MILRFITWILEALLGRAVDKAVTGVTDMATEKIEDASVKEISAENAKKYADAQTRIDQIKAAEDLLNRMRTPHP